MIYNYSLGLFAVRNSISRLTEVALIYNRCRKLFLNSSDRTKFERFPAILKDNIIFEKSTSSLQ